mgnify:CR=1 FL=1
MSWQVIHGDCLDALRAMPDASVDAVVTDPPYGLSFMGKKWDYDVPGTDVWAECLRVLKPGGHLLAFAGTRTQHRMCVRIEDAGFEIRDMIAWVYGQGFPKSLDVSKAIDKAAGLMGHEGKNFRNADDGVMTLRPTIKPSEYVRPDPISTSARQWSGWGTALKPAMEMVTMARKPLDGTVASNVQEWGTGAINVEGCRVPGNDHASAWDRPVSTNIGAGSYISDGTQHVIDISANKPSGRWPANLIHDGSDEVVAGFPVTGVSKGIAQFKTHATYQWSKSHADATVEPQHGTEIGYGDSGSASRFFYCAKASKADRNSGGVNSNHPTVKPTALMQYLCRLVTPPGGTVLDPFTGSGSTGKAAILEGFNFIGIERETEYVEIARARIADAERRRSENLVSA